MQFVIRPVRQSDAEDISKIYAPYVENTAISFETTPPGQFEMSRRITEISHKYPYLVCEHEGKIIGYTYVSAYNPRQAYDWTVTSSIYIMSGFQKSGVGTALYSALFELLEKQGFFNVLAIIVYPHEQSISFHKKHGFISSGILHGCGYKFNIWHDIMIMEKKLKNDNSEVKKILPFCELESEFVKNITEKFSKSLLII